MKPLLYIGVGVPWQEGAGYLVRQNMFLEALAECVDLHLVLFNYDINAPRPHFPCDITPIEIFRHRSLSKAQQLFKDCFSPLPRWYRNYDLEKIQKPMTDLDLKRFPVIFSYRADYTYLAGVTQHPHLIIDVDDPEYLRRKGGFILRKNWQYDWRSRWDFKKMEVFERSLIKKAKMAFVCLKKDAIALNLPNLKVIPNTVAIPHSVDRHEKHDPTIIFVGNMSGGKNSPNNSGLVWFLEEVWPSICQQIPNCHFQLIGKISEVMIEFINPLPHVESLGFVDNLAPIYSSAWLSVAPIKYGTGTRIKILEALAHGCPVVTTPKGCEGIELINNEHIIESHEEQFTISCINILHNKVQRKQLSIAGHKFMLEHYSREKQHQKLVALFKDILFKPNPIDI
ncbi:glycosyltransferase [Crocosphaera sp.]|uniref:glycosyltransferase family 4 protein n=1 Tax=Crocosphaera sp. TaxID=2729996 RepID=UPI00257DD72A|nr:glycosyltransferase [Crocosphaera sp.]NQZ63330.1 glycosyltransferase family 4 protein [Crocosphaera sp.]